MRVTSVAAAVTAWLLSELVAAHYGLHFDASARRLEPAAPPGRDGLAEPLLRRLLRAARVRLRPPAARRGRRARAIAGGLHHDHDHLGLDGHRWWGSARTIACGSTSTPSRWS